MVQGPNDLPDALKAASIQAPQSQPIRLKTGAAPVVEKLVQAPDTVHLSAKAVEAAASAKVAPAPIVRHAPPVVPLVLTPAAPPTPAPSSAPAAPARVEVVAQPLPPAIVVQLQAQPEVQPDRVQAAQAKVAELGGDNAQQNAKVAEKLLTEI